MFHRLSINKNNNLIQFSFGQYILKILKNYFNGLLFLKKHMQTYMLILKSRTVVLPSQALEKYEALDEEQTPRYKHPINYCLLT